MSDKRQISIRIGLDGSAEVARSVREIGDAGDSAARRLVTNFDKATAAVNRQDAALRKAAATQKDWNPGTPGAAPISSLEPARQRLAAEKAMAEKMQAAQAAFMAAARGGANASLAGMPSGIKSPQDSMAAFLAAEERAAARQQMIARAIQENQAREFRESFERQIGITRTPAGSAGATSSALDARAKALEAEARDMETLKSRAAALRAELDPLSAAQERLTSKTAEYNRMLEKGLLNDNEVIAAKKSAQAEYDKAAAYAARAKKGNALTSFQTTNLVYQLNDIGSGLAMGQHPGTVALQQLPQVYQVFMGTGMGFMGAMKAIGTTLAGLISPATATAAGLTAVAGGLTYLEYHSIRVGKDMDAALTGTGRASGVTPDQIDAMARSAAAQSDNGISSARSYIETFVKNGVAGSNSGRLAAIVPNFAATTGQERDAALKELTSDFGDLGKGVDDLDAKTGAFDAASKRRIKTLWEEGQRAEATAEAIKILAQSLGNFRDQQTWLGRLKGSVLTGIGDLFEPKEVSTKEQIAALQREKNNPLARDSAHLFWSGEDFNRQIDALNRQQQQSQTDAGKKKDQQDDQRRGGVIDALMQRYVPQTQDAEIYRTLGSEHYNARMALSDPKVLKSTGRSLEEERYLYDAIEHAAGTHKSSYDMFAESQQISVASAAARTPAEKANVARRQMTLSLSGQHISGQEAAAREQLAYDSALATSNVQINQQNQLLEENISLTGRDTAAWLKGRSAALQASAAHQGIIDSLQSGSDAAHQSRLYLAQSVAETGSGGAQQVAALKEQTSAREALNASVTAGKASWADFNQQLELSATLSPLIAARQAALSAGLKDQAAALTKVISAYKTAANDDVAAGRKTLALQGVDQLDRQGDTLSRQLDMSRGSAGGMGVDMQEQLGWLRDENTLISQGYATRKDNITLLTTEGELYLQQKQRVQELNEALGRTKSANDSMYQVEAGFFDKFGQQLTSAGADWDAWLQSCLASFQQTAAQLALVNPLKNIILGGDESGHALPTINDVGGTIGHWLGNDASGPDITPVGVTGRRGSLADMAALGVSPTRPDSAIADQHAGGISGLETRIGHILGSGLFSDDAIPYVGVTGRKGRLTDMIASGQSPTLNNNWWDDAENWVASVFHSGGMVTTAANSNRSLPANVYRFAPRFHDGAYLKPDEMPAILQSGERVLNRAETAEYNSGRSNAASYISAPTVNIHNNGSAVAISNSSYNAKTNTFDLGLEDMTTDYTRNGLRNGTFDTAMGDRYGATPLLTQR